VSPGYEPPYGWVWGAEGEVLEHPGEQRVRLLVLSMHAQGESGRRITAELNRLCPHLARGSQFWTMTVSRILKRARLYG